MYGKVRSRQGGSATNWNTAGTNTYDYSATNVFIQAGTFAYDGVGSDVVTFPTAFSQPPIVVATVVTSAASNEFARISAITATNFSIQLITDGGAAAADTFNWIAIGE